MIRIAVDAMGSDDHPEPDVMGAVLAAREYHVEIFLVGNENMVKPVLETQNPGDLPIHIIHAPDMLTMEDKGEKLAFKTRHRDSQTSMAVGIRMLKNHEADAFVTAGNTGGAWLTSLFNLGRIRGVDRPGLAPIFPTASGSCVVIDTGANPDCKPENLLQFGIMGSIYAQTILGRKNPKVGLISNGEEEGKGNELVRAATPLLKNSSLNFIGNVEGKEVIGGKVDVAVTDGFTGNVMLKTAEAVGKLIIEKMVSSIKNGGFFALLGGALIKPALRGLKKLLDPSEQGAAVLLGINGLVLVGHGRSDSQAIKNAIRVAMDAVESNLIDSIKNAIESSLDTKVGSL